MKGLLVNNLFCIPANIQTIEESILTFTGFDAKAAMVAMYKLNRGELITLNHRRGKMVHVCIEYGRK